METNPAKEEEEIDNVTPFRVIQGGKTPPEGNWLKDFPPRTRFISRMKTNNTFLRDEFLVGYHTQQCTYLLKFPEEISLLVDTAQFSRDNEWLETL